jgi:hypothetical protein
MLSRMLAKPAASFVGRQQQAIPEGQTNSSFYFISKSLTAMS